MRRHVEFEQPPDLEKGGAKMMAVVKFIGVYFVVSIGAGLILGRIIQFVTRDEKSTPDESKARSLSRLDGVKHIESSPW
jgi:hypothetical protein